MPRNPRNSRKLPVTCEELHTLSRKLTILATRAMAIGDAMKAEKITEVVVDGKRQADTAAGFVSSLLSNIQDELMRP